MAISMVSDHVHHPFKFPRHNGKSNQVPTTSLRVQRKFLEMHDSIVPRIGLPILWSCFAFVSGAVGVDDAVMYAKQSLARQMVNERDESLIDLKKKCRYS